MKRKAILFLLAVMASAVTMYADNYEFDYAVIDNEKVTTVSAPNITANLVNACKATVTYRNETVVLTSEDGYEFKGFGESGVIIVAHKQNGALRRITIGAVYRGQTIMLVYKRINY